MAARPHELNWGYILNTPIPDFSTGTRAQKSSAFQFKEWLKVAGWIPVLGCLGGTSASAVVAGDPADTYDLINFGGNGTWIVFESPEGIVAGLDGSYTGDQSRLWCLVYMYSPASAKISFSRSLYSGGAWNARPTSTGETIANTIDMEFAPYTPLVSQQRNNFWYTSSGSFMYRAGYVTNTGPAGYFSTAIEVMRLVQPTKINASNKDFPFAVYIKRMSSSTNIDLNTQIVQGETAGLTGWGLDGAAINIRLGAFKDYYGYIGNNEGSTGNGLNGEATASYLLAVATGAYPGVIGRVPDIGVVGGPIPQGAVDNADFPTWCKSGALQLPVNQALSF